MGNSGDAGADRLRKLDEIRSEIEKAIANGDEVVADQWVQKYPDLNPELRELLEQLIARESSVATIAGATGRWRGWRWRGWRWRGWRWRDR